MEVYLVYHSQTYEFNEVVGVFSDYVKAREFELEYIRKYEVDELSSWTEIRKVEVNKDYDAFGNIGEEV